MSGRRTADDQKPADESPALELRSVSVRFGGLLALHEVDLTVPAASVIGLIGPNGAGKTTLFNCVTGVVAPFHGRILIFGTEVTGWPTHRRARLGVGRTYQRLELFGSLSVLENLIMAAESAHSRAGVFSDLLALPPAVEGRAAAIARAGEVLELLGIAEYAPRLAGELPLGLARLVELGRALCADPRLLLLDEPSSGLRVDESDRLAEILAQLRKEAQLSILVVEHDMAFVLGLCQRVSVLDFGRLLAEGTPREIKADAVVQAAYLGDELDRPAPKKKRSRAPAARG